MSKQLAEFIDLIINSAGDLASSLGLNRVVGQLYALLYFSPHPLSLDEMTKRLKMSKGNTSLNIRELEKWEAVRKVWVKGSRKDYYEANLDIPGVVLNRLKTGLTRRLDKAMDLINQAESALKEIPNQKEDIRIYRKRLNQIKQMHKLVTSLLAHLSPKKISLLRRLL